MKINSLSQNYAGITKTGGAKEKEVAKDLVTLGGQKEDLQLMDKTALDVKSGIDPTPFIYMALGAAAAGGALVAGVGWAGRAIGGFPGALVATGLSAAGVGLFMGKEDKKMAIKGAIMGGTMAATGAALGPWGLLAGAAEPIGFMYLNEKTGF